MTLQFIATRGGSIDPSSICCNLYARITVWNFDFQIRQFSPKNFTVSNNERLEIIDWSIEELEKREVEIKEEDWVLEEDKEEAIDNNKDLRRKTKKNQMKKWRVRLV